MKRALTLLLLLSLTLSFTACRTESDDEAVTISDEAADADISSIIDTLPDNGCC